MFAAHLALTSASKWALWRLCRLAASTRRADFADHLSEHLRAATVLRVLARLRSSATRSGLRQALTSMRTRARLERARVPRP